jgi:hypothetical protein
VRESLPTRWNTTEGFEPIREISQFNEAFPQLLPIQAYQSSVGQQHQQALPSFNATRGRPVLIGRQRLRCLALRERPSVACECSRDIWNIAIGAPDAQDGAFGPGLAFASTYPPLRLPSHGGEHDAVACERIIATTQS